jgi:WD40 repeat protein
MPRNVLILFLLAPMVAGWQGIVLAAPPAVENVSPEGAQPAASTETSPRVFELPEGTVSRQPVRTFFGHTLRVGRIAFLPKGDRLVSVSNDATFRLWNVETGEPVRQIKLVQGRGEMALAPDGCCAAVSAGRGILLLNISDNESKPEILRELEVVDGGFICHLKFSPNGQTLAAANRDGSIVLWDVMTGRFRQRLQATGDQARSVAFSPRGERVISAGYDKLVRIWDPQSGEKVRVLSGHAKPLLAVAVSPDGRQVLSGGFDQVARLWDFATGSELRAFKGHTEGIDSVAFSPDGRQCLTASEDRTARLWDLETGVELHRFVGHKDYVLDAIFSPDGRFIATSSGGNRKDGHWVPGEEFDIRLWRVPASRAPSNGD